MLGTPYYMAPEQVTGENITEQVDVYAFGILLFELLTGQKPIAGDTVERIFYSILNEPLDVNPLHSRRRPAAVIDLVAALHRQEAGRPAAGFRRDRRRRWIAVRDDLEARHAARRDSS